MIQTFLFDLGNVLAFFSHERMFEQIGALCEKSGPEVRELLIGSGLQSKFDHGLLSEAGFQGELEQIVGQKFDSEELYRAGADIFELNTSMMPVLDALKSSGYRLVLLSNTNHAHIRFIRDSFDVLDYFDDFVLSHEVGANKPAAAIYEAALAKIDCAPSNCFYTDDIEEFVLAGRRFGLGAEVFTNTTSLVNQLRQRGIDLPPGVCDA